MKTLLTEGLPFLGPIIVGAFVLAWWLRDRRLRASMTAAIDDASCVACGSTDLEVVAEGAYRCMACGYEGGSGRAALQEAAERAAIEKLPMPERRQRARAELEEARDLVLGALGGFRSVLSHSMHDLLGAGDKGAAKQTELVSCLGELERAAQGVRRASMLLGDDALQVRVPEFDAFSAAFLGDQRGDALRRDLAVHKDIKRIAAEAELMQEGIEAALARMP